MNPRGPQHDRGRSPLSYYVAYGLSIRSRLRLPELFDGGAQPELEIRLGRSEPTARDAIDDNVCVRTTCEEVQVAWPTVGRFLVRRGREILVHPARDADERTLRLFLLGPALAILLHQRGFLTLHASAVTLDGGATCFLGASGWGKSTLAALLHARGHALVTDDVAAIDLAGSPRVLPGTPQLKLWPDTLASLGERAEALPRVHPQLEKRARAIERRHPSEPVPLRRLYILAQAPLPSIQPLGPQEALLELLRHSYGARTLQAVRREDHFRQCARLASQVPVRRLAAPRDLGALPALARLIEQDCADAP